MRDVVCYGMCMHAQHVMFHPDSVKVEHIIFYQAPTAGHVVSYTDFLRKQEHDIKQRQWEVDEQVRKDELQRVDNESMMVAYFDGVCAGLLTDAAGGRADLGLLWRELSLEKQQFDDKMTMYAFKAQFLQLFRGSADTPAVSVVVVKGAPLKLRGRCGTACVECAAAVWHCFCCSHAWSSSVVRWHGHRQDSARPAVAVRPHPVLAAECDSASGPRRCAGSPQGHRRVPRSARVKAAADDAGRRSRVRDRRCVLHDGVHSHRVLHVRLLQSDLLERPALPIVEGGGSGRGS